MTTAVTLAALLITAAGFLTWETGRRARAALRRVRRAAAQDQIGDDTIRMLHPQWCNPCNDTPGRCTCAGLCGHPACVGDHTVTWDMGAELEAMLRQGEQ